MNITIVGAGNMGLAITAYLSVKGQHQVTLFTEKDILADGPLTMDDVEGQVRASTDHFTVTGDGAKAFSDADMILCTYPAFLRKAFIEENGKFFKCGAKVGFVPGYGGAEYFCKDLIDNGVVVFGLQRVPYVARARKTDTGRIAGILSKKNSLYTAAIPHKYTDEIAAILQDLLDIPCVALKEYLAITLAPSNPLLHISGLYNVFKDYQPGVLYPDVLPFYEQWNDETSRLLLTYDDELQAICKRLAPLDMCEVVPLTTYYESPTAEAMTHKLQSIESFKAVMVPLKKVENGSVPDLQSRMFVEDFPFGVCIIKAFAQMTGVETPVVDMLLDFYTRLSGYRYFNADGTLAPDAANTGIPSLFGLQTKEDIIAFYHGTK